MPNVLDVLIPKILARSLMSLRLKVVMPRLVNGDYSSEGAKKGAVITVPIPKAQTVTDVTPSNTKPALVDTTPDQVLVPLDQWKGTSFHLTDQDMLRIAADENFIPMQTMEAIIALAENVNGYLLDLYKEVPNWVGTAATTPFATDASAAINARKTLHALKCPGAGRVGVLDLNAEANALALAVFADADKAGTTTVKIEGEIGRKYGVDWYSDQQVKTHVRGATTGTSIAVNGLPAVHPIGGKVLNVDGLTAGFVKGDIFTIAGDTTQYTVISAATFGGGAQVLTEIFPALRVAPADNAVITVVATHVASLVFHRNAFAFAMRPLLDATQGANLNSRILSMTDPETGITLRLEVTRVHKALTWEFDILYGGRCVRPEYATRILG